MSLGGPYRIAGLDSLKAKPPTYLVRGLNQINGGVLLHDPDHDLHVPCETEQAAVTIALDERDKGDYDIICVSLEDGPNSGTIIAEFRKECK